MRRKYLALSSALETVVQDLDERRHVRDLGVVETLLLPALAVVGHFVAVHIARVLTRKVVKPKFRPIAVGRRGRLESEAG